MIIYNIGEDSISLIFVMNKPAAEKVRSASTDVGTIVFSESWTL